MQFSLKLFFHVYFWNQGVADKKLTAFIFWTRLLYTRHECLFTYLRGERAKARVCEILCQFLIRASFNVQAPNEHIKNRKNFKNNWLKNERKINACVTKGASKCRLQRHLRFFNEINTRFEHTNIHFFKYWFKLKPQLSIPYFVCIHFQI